MEAMKPNQTRYDAAFTGDSEHVEQELTFYRHAVEQAADRLDMDLQYEDVLTSRDTMAPPMEIPNWCPDFSKHIFMGRDQSEHAGEEGEVVMLTEVYGNEDGNVGLRYRNQDEPRYRLTAVGDETVRDVLEAETGQELDASRYGFLHDLEHGMTSSLLRGDALL